MALRVRSAMGLVVAVLFTGSAFGQTVTLGEEVKPGELFRYELDLKLAGKMKVERQGKLDAIPFQAIATHKFVERIESGDARGGVGKVLRHYEVAKSNGDSGVDRTSRELAADRRIVIAQRTTDGSLHFSPDGPLYREELELVAEHFDTLCIPALLPNKELKIGDTWPIGAEASQHVCLFEGLIKSELVGKLTEIKDGQAVFTITGVAEGIEGGAHAKLSITATGTFAIATKRVVELKWEQSDDRAQGPASPATEVKAILTLKRTALSEEPKELNATVRAKIPADAKITDLVTMLRYADADGRYQFVYPREWHVVGRTKDHLVMRLLEKGEFTAQATMTTWKRATAGQHTPADEFKKLLANLPGWVPEAVTEDSVIPTDAGRWLYRVALKGKQDGLPVVQSFFLLAGPNGDQLAVTVLARQEQAAKVGTRDITLVNAIEFPTPKR